MNFRNVADLDHALRTWTLQEPKDVDVVVGVPRSGLLAATLLALHANVPVTDVDGLLAGRLLTTGRTRRHRHSGVEDLLATRRRVLVVDDSLLTGGTLRQVRERIEASGVDHHVEYLVVYAEEPSDLAEHVELVPRPRMFEWNLLHHDTYLPRMMIDLDGVLCRDPEPDDNDDGSRYERFVRTAAPLVRPTAPVGWIVTSRLERYRSHTEAWLEEHGIEHGHLLMLDLDDGDQRRRARPHSAFKADAYRASDAIVFVESSIRQAVEIAEFAHRDVICTDTMQLFRPGSTRLPGTPQDVEPLGRTLRRWARRSLPAPIVTAVRWIRRRPSRAR